jgi:hypothetical protein
MTPGTVLYHSTFEFHDGGIGKKYLIVLNDGICGYYLVAKTTSQPRNKSFSSGCNSRDIYPNFYIPEGNVSCLREGTWICLNEFYEFRNHELLSGRFKGIIEHKGCLPTDICGPFLECTKECQDITIAQGVILEDVLRRCFSSKS